MRTSSKNPKLEYRNTKQTKKLKFELRIPKSETGAKRIPKSLNEFVSHFVFFDHLNLFRVSDFEFRVWSF